MTPSRRSTVLALVLALLCASFGAVAQPPVAHAAGTFTVTTTRDLLGSTCGSDPDFPGICSLRQALNAAIAAGDSSIVEFNIPANDSYGPMPGYNSATKTWTILLGFKDALLPISPNNPLPLISRNNLFINGDSQADFSGLSNLGPLIFIDGTHIDNRGGLTVIGTTDVHIWRLGIINFGGDPGTPGDLPGVGIELLNATGTKIRGCYVGVNQAGNGSAPNDAAGLLIQGGSANIIGGNNSANDEYNVFSGNTNDGILIRFSNNNQIIGNRLGVDTDGITAIPNGSNGIQLVLGSSGNRIGPPADHPFNDATLRNIIAGNNAYGVLVNESNNTNIHGNWIGANNLFNVRLPNRLGGIAVLSTNAETANNNLIGGNTTSTRNIISGNNGPGVSILGPNASNNIIANNYIGVGFSNSVAVTNTIGILLTGGPDNNTIGGNGTTSRNNIISGNSQDGIQISGAINNLSRLNIISGNTIGMAPNGTTIMPNGGNGIRLASNTYETTIGAVTAPGSNVISGNDADGIQISGTGTLTNTILKNTIRYNDGDGIRLNNAWYTKVDGGDANNLNLISDNGGNGVRVTSSQTTTLQFNIVRHNNGNGIHVSNSLTTIIQSNQIGLAQGNCVVLPAPVCGNKQGGVLVDTGSYTTTISANSIRLNTGKAIEVLGGSQHVKILDNTITRNGAGINLEPETTGALGNPGNSNHDINTPFALRVNQAGQLTGRVLNDNTNSSTRAASCFGCKIQVFGTDRNVLDGQGRDKLLDVEVGAGGYFTATLSSIPQQLALTATDSGGNTSEFAVFNKVYGLNIYTAAEQHALPGQTITYTHRISNTGTVDFTDLQLSAFSKYTWPFTLAPANPISLAAGQSKPVTVTLTLPTGSDPRVTAGNIELTRVTIKSTTLPTVTASLTDTTFVDGKFILQVDPLSRNGITTQNTSIDYPHTLTNVGNLTGTLTLTASTDLGWNTTLTPLAVTLTPGQSIGATARVVLPQQVNAGTIAKTVIKITASDPTQNKIITDTTTVSLQPLATMVPNQEGDAGASETISFQHTVTNLSNGTATFKLIGASSLGSKIKFRSNSPGIVLGSDNSFTVSNTAGSNFFNFFVDITVDPKAFRGDTDTVTIGLTTPEGTVIGGASVQDKINVTRSAMVPRLYMPLIMR